MGVRSGRRRVSIGFDTSRSASSRVFQPAVPTAAATVTSRPPIRALRHAIVWHRLSRIAGLAGNISASRSRKLPSIVTWRGVPMQIPIDRRQFLERTAVGAAGLVLGSATPAFARSAQSPSGMFVSLAPWATARGVGWPDQARLAARVGYRGIDYSWGPAKEAGVEATRALLQELGIVPTICNLPGPNPLNGDEAAFRARMTTLADDAAFSAAIGSRRFQLVMGATTPGGQAKEERWKVVRDRLAAISEVLVKHDVHLSLEFLGPLVFRTGRGGGGGRRGGAPPDPNAPPPAPPVPFVW